jgi:hypothetical protein
MSARALTAGMLAELRSGNFKPLFLVEVWLAGGPVRLFTGHGEMTWNSVVWTGDGGMLKISQMAEASELQAMNFTLTLNGAVSQFSVAALTQIRRGLPGTVWLALVNSSNQIIADPFPGFKGRTDTSKIVPDPMTAEISISYESRLITARKTKVRRYTSEDQHIDYPDDLGFDYVPSLQDKTITWGFR